MIALTLLFIGLYIVLGIAKVIAEEFLIESHTAYLGQWPVAAVLIIGYYLALLRAEIPPGWCLLAALGMTSLATLCSWGIPVILEYLLGWGDDDEPPGVLLPMAMALLLFLVFIPTGFTRMIGFPDLFSGQMNLFVLAVVGQGMLLALLLWLGNWSPISLGWHWLASTMLLIAVMAVAINSTPSRTRAWVLTSVLIVVVDLEMAAGLLLADYWGNLVELEANFVKKQLYAVTTQFALITAIYLFPVLAKLLSAWF